MDKTQKKLMSMGEPAMGSIYDEEELHAVQKVLENSIITFTGFRAATEVETFERLFSQYCDVQYATLLNGAGTAIDLALRCLNIEPGDEIISCAINFHGTHLSIINSGAKLVLCEPDPKTLNIGPYDVKKKLTPKTKAILVTHMNGLPADTDLLNKIIDVSGIFTKESRPKIICDSARTLGTTYKNRVIGKNIWATIFSFQSKKIITTLGEGGMIVTNDNKFDNQLKDFRTFGRGVNWGSNYKISKLQAAVGIIQLKKLKKLVEKRRKLAAYRNKELSIYSEITIQKDTEYAKNCYYLYTLILPKNRNGEKRNKLMRVLSKKYGIGSVIANPPTYQSNLYISLHTSAKNLPMSEDLGERILCLSLHPAMRDETNRYIVDSFKLCYEKIFR